MIIRIYLRASTQDQDAERALLQTTSFCKNHYSAPFVTYIENISGTKLNRPKLNKLLQEADQGDILLVESIDRLSRLSQPDFFELKMRIHDKGLKLVVLDLPTTHNIFAYNDEITSSIINVINQMIIDLLATMARLDNQKRIERIKQGLARSNYRPTGKKPNLIKHKRIIELLSTQKMTKQEVANAVGVGIATVYRVNKQTNH